MKQTHMYVCTLEEIYSSRHLDTLLHKVEVITLENTLVFIYMQQYLELSENSS